MTLFCPAYPKPHSEKASKLSLFWHARRSWLDALYERSYSMQMGEVHLPGVDLYMVNDSQEMAVSRPKRNTWLLNENRGLLGNRQQV